MAKKNGIDDWFASGKTAADLDALITYFEVFAADLGQETGRRRWTTEQHADVFKGWHYRFAINDMNEAIEVNDVPLDDTQFAIIEAQMRDEEIPVEHAKKSIVVLADINRYHSIKRYLDALKWDGTDHIAWLAQYFKDKENIFSTWLKRWLVGAVAKVMGDGKHQNFMLVLDGGQGIGKSHFAHWICPLEKYFLESPLNPDDKDTLIRLMSSFIWEVGELGSVTKRDDKEALKRIISMQSVRVRQPYGHFDTVKPALASFIGTVNDEAGFLNDPTGSRRYAVCTLTEIDWNYTDVMDINQVWAQAVSLYQSGEPWELSGAEGRQRDDINADYELLDPLDDMIALSFDIDPSRAAEKEWQMTTSQVLAALALKEDSRPYAMRLAVALKKAGLGKAKRFLVGSSRARFYCGLKRKE